MFNLPFISPTLVNSDIDTPLKIEIAKVCLRLIISWIAYFVLLLFHTDLAVLPSMFSSKVLQTQNLSEVEIEVLLLWMLVFVTLPLLLLIIIIDTISQPKDKSSALELKDIRSIYLANYFVSIAYAVLNVIHAFIEFFVAVNVSQIFLCCLLLVLGFKITKESYNLVQVINDVLDQT